ncbi:uncharacterized protein LOC135830130 [Sycon ciliatum]|uniref:uncharacterized protein LOC135830130 n=1 Tax=Sycon ciliatum TaxID=27933 RepID=UPI0020AE6708
MADVNPVQDSDFDKLFELEANKDAADGWSLHASGDGYETWVRKRNDEKLNLIKTYYHVKGVTRDQLYDLMFEPSLRRRFDTNMKEYRFVKEFAYHKILYTCVAMNVPLLADRDFVVTHVPRKTPTESYVINRQLETDLVPKVPGLVRGESIYSGFILRDVEGDETAASMCYFLQVNFKVPVPAHMVNSKAADKPVAFMKRLQDFVTNVYAAELAAASG